MCAFSEAGAKSLSLAIQFIETMLVYCRQSDSLDGLCSPSDCELRLLPIAVEPTAMLLEQFCEEALTEPLRQLEAAIVRRGCVISIKTTFRLNAVSRQEAVPNVPCSWAEGAAVVVSKDGQYADLTLITRAERNPPERPSAAYLRRQIQQANDRDRLASRRARECARKAPHPRVLKREELCAGFVSLLLVENNSRRHDAVRPGDDSTKRVRVSAFPPANSR